MTTEEEPPDCYKFSPRGFSVCLPHKSLPEVISPHLLKLIRETGGVAGPIGKQFISNSKKEAKYYKKSQMDPLSEEEHEVAPGLVYKYRGRALWTITNICASYCRFCTRGRIVGNMSRKCLLNQKQVEQTLTFIKKHKELKEIILSGGDPLTCPKGYLEKIILPLSVFQKEGVIDVIRIGTRVPVSNPAIIKDWHYDLLSQIKNPYIMVHINHPDELTKETIEKLVGFRQKCLATILSQTVLLRGVNDNEQVLTKLFNKMVREGIRPYYVYQNDPVYWAKHFTVPIKQAIKLWQKLRPKLSGLSATARFVIDTPYGYGKIAVPEGGSWKVDYDGFLDFKGTKHSL